MHAARLEERSAPIRCPLLAGLILITSAFYASIFRAVVFMLAALLALTAHKFDVTPEVGPLLPNHLSMIVHGVSKT